MIIIIILMVCIVCKRQYVARFLYLCILLCGHSKTAGLDLKSVVDKVLI